MKILPLVSVIMCCYNEQRYIRESIESVLAQTYNDFEFIIWNDGSTDKTEEIIKSYNDPRIRYYYHKNTGLGEALRLACQEANGRYIARIDCDDICMPERFEKQVLFLENHPDYVLCSSGVYYIDAEGKVFGRRFPALKDKDIRRRITAITHPATMFRTESYRKAGGYYPLRSAQDRILWSRLLQQGKFANLMEPLIKYRVLNNSVSHVIQENSIYGNMIELIRKKICSDLEYNAEDVELHNTIYSLAKRSFVPTNVSTEYKLSIEEKIYKISKIFFSENVSTSIVYVFKNVYLFFS